LGVLPSSITASIQGSTLSVTTPPLTVGTLLNDVDCAVSIMGGVNPYDGTNITDEFVVVFPALL
jgi:hypothetical protein